MSRFFRSALFPLIVIVLVVYLASQTLLPNRDEAQEIAYGELIQRVDSGQSDVSEVLFIPKSQTIEAVVDGTKVKTNYPTPESQFAFQQLLREEGVTDFDSKGTGGSTWTSILPVRASRSHAGRRKAGRCRR